MTGVFPAVALQRRVCHGNIVPALCGAGCSQRFGDGASALRERAAGGGNSQLRTTTAALVELQEWLTSHEVIHVAMEATGVYWKPVWHLLEEHLTLVLANAQHIRNVPGRKTDVNHAACIADLLAHGLIRSSFVPPAPIQALRDFTRTRKQLVREISQHTLRIQKTLEDANLKPPWIRRRAHRTG